MPLPYGLISAVRLYLFLKFSKFLAFNGKKPRAINKRSDVLATGR